MGKVNDINLKLIIVFKKKQYVSKSFFKGKKVLMFFFIKLSLYFYLETEI